MPLDPAPRAHPAPYTPQVWPAGKRTQLKPRDDVLTLNLVELMEQRQTRREFEGTLTDAVLGEFLWLACRSRSSRSSPYGADQESRPHPSAGGMHPIHVLVCAPGAPWSRYDPVAHALEELPQSAANAALAREAAGQLVNVQRGLVIALVAEPGKTAAKYHNPESLVWRDAGVLLGFMAVVAEALSISFCPLGITGEPYLSRLVENSGTLHGAGLAVVGVQRMGDRVS